VRPIADRLIDANAAAIRTDDDEVAGTLDVEIGQRRPDDLGPDATRIADGYGEPDARLRA
jgi:hypothetical protein